MKRLSLAVLLFAFAASVGFSSALTSPNCTGATSCKECARKVLAFAWTTCVWCGDVDECRPGHFYGADIACSKWRWGQCFVDGLWFEIGLASCLALAFVLFIVCVCCCCFGCCRRKKQPKYKQLPQKPEYRSMQSLPPSGTVSVNDDLGEPLIGSATSSRTPQTDKRRAEMRAKWGV